jgi:hypothetical protein
MDDSNVDLAVAFTIGGKVSIRRRSRDDTYPEESINLSCNGIAKEFKEEAFMMGQQANSSTEKKQLLTRGFTSINSTEEELKRWEQSAINEIINAVAAYLDKQRQQQK